MYISSMNKNNNKLFLVGYYATYFSQLKVDYGYISFSK